VFSLRSEDLSGFSEDSETTFSVASTTWEAEELAFRYQYK
jgi:hypothetical protein